MIVKVEVVKTNNITPHCSLDARIMNIDSMVGRLRIGILRLLTT